MPGFYQLATPVWNNEGFPALRGSTNWIIWGKLKQLTSTVFSRRLKEEADMETRADVMLRPSIIYL